MCCSALPGLLVGCARLQSGGLRYFDKVQDLGNHCVLSWPSAAAFTNGQAAELFIGREDFTSGDGTHAADRFYRPEAAVVETSGSLWMVDTEINRVLRFDPLSATV